MRKPFQYIKWKIILHAPLLLLLTLSTAITNVSAGVSPYSPADAISMDPSTVTIPAVGQTATVNITITNITDCAGYQIYVNYNDTLLEPSAWTADTDPANPMTETQIAPASAGRVDTDFSVVGTVKFSVVWKLGVTTYNGSGVAAQITFNGTMVGNSTLYFDEDWTYATDYWGDDIYFAAFSGCEIEVIPEFPAAIAMPLLLIATLAATFLAKMVWSRKRRRPAVA